MALIAAFAVVDEVNTIAYSTYFGSRCLPIGVPGDVLELLWSSQPAKFTSWADLTELQLRRLLPPRLHHDIADLILFANNYSLELLARRCLLRFCVASPAAINNQVASARRSSGAAIGMFLLILSHRFAVFHASRIWQLTAAAISNLILVEGPGNPIEQVAKKLRSDYAAVKVCSYDCSPLLINLINAIMCAITKMYCSVCKTKKKRYTFIPCKEFIEELIGSGTMNITFTPGTRLHCPRLKWPINPNIDITHTICVECAYMGQVWYQGFEKAKRLMKQVNKDHNRKLFDPSRGPSATNNIMGDAGVENVHEDNDADANQNANGRDIDALPAEELNMLLPPGFAGCATFQKRHLISTWEKKKEASPEEAAVIAYKFEQRKKSFLTIWIPCCTLCKKPTVDDAVDGGIADVEFELDVILWPILQGVTSTQAYGSCVTINIATGFIHKPCHACVKEEEKLRQLVEELLQTCERVEAWAVWTWLLSRGVGDIPFSDHGCVSVGLPMTQPPSIQSIMMLMSLSWQRQSGVAWEDVVKFAPPTSCPLRSTVHSQPLLDLYQWPEFAEPRSGKELEIRRPVPGVDYRLGPTEVCEDGAMDEALENEAVEGRSEDELMEKVLDDQPAVPSLNLASEMPQIGITDNHLDNSDIDHPAKPRTRKASSGEGPESKRRKVDHVRDCGREVAQKARAKAIIKFSHPENKANKHWSWYCESQTEVGIPKILETKAWMLVVRFEGAYINGEGQAAIKQNLSYPVVKETPAKTPEVQTPPVTEDGIHTPESQSAATQATPTEPGSSRGKHVHFPSTPKDLEEVLTLDNSLEIEGYDRFGNKQSSEQAGPSNGNTRGAEESEETDVEIPEECGFFTECSMGCLHLIDPYGTQPGMIFNLPIGLSSLEPQVQEGNHAQHEEPDLGNGMKASQMPLGSCSESVEPELETGGNEAQIEEQNLVQ
ncbi:uncharacterized protein BCR38DRAFT_528880 [Pseudomassariella vexata]|uniref:Uncharacterized protein n=1 Tax=Pseudomassariella vexata TaxID=1141098 RepID=A0A1Y2D879_9PEZI|nr:uncharacterized protein BCR38DRAFT_528880 [Pseudomassariella vexata]ORY55473.1 hypothetical protein BCR38DRAFT_528880 [Pseudomassariella vexata]